jgi:transposase
VKRVREWLSERAAALEPILVSIDGLTFSIGTMSKELTAEAKHDELADRLRSVPGVGVLTALRFIATVD